jgi:hypothetical protein|nr:MAG TPA: exonuclease [Caudoviricetes sp.]
MIKLNQSSVVFTQEDHRYFLDGKELSGITGLIKSQLFRDKYKDIPHFVLEKAAERGTLVHESIELLDGGFTPSELTSEIENYKRIKAENELTTIANEYIVSDNAHFASAIDLVMSDKEENIILADIKTTSVLDKEYCRWQLSIYAYLFELQNPELEVGKLYALWLRGDKAEFAELERIDKEIIKNLLQCEVDGVQFINPLLKEDAKVPVEIKNAEIAVYTLINQIKELDAKKKELSAGLLKLMQDNDVKSYKGEYITLSRKAAYTKKSIDSKKLEDKYPEVYADCIKTTDYPETLQIK